MAAPNAGVMQHSAPIAAAPSIIVFSRLEPRWKMIAESRIRTPRFMICWRTPMRPTTIQTTPAAVMIATTSRRTAGGRSRNWSISASAASVIASANTGFCECQSTGRPEVDRS